MCRWVLGLLIIVNGSVRAVSNQGLSDSEIKRLRAQHKVLLEKINTAVNGGEKLGAIMAENTFLTTLSQSNPFFAQQLATEAFNDWGDKIPNVTTPLLGSFGRGTSGDIQGVSLERKIKKMYVHKQGQCPWSLWCCCCGVSD